MICISSLAWLSGCRHDDCVLVQSGVPTANAQPNYLDECVDARQQVPVYVLTTVGEAEAVKATLAALVRSSSFRTQLDSAGAACGQLISVPECSSAVVILRGCTVRGMRFEPVSTTVARRLQLNYCCVQASA